MAAIVSVVVSLPVAPGFIGQFHFAFVVGLDLINRIDDSVAGGRNLRHGRRSLAALEMTRRGTSVFSWGWCQAMAIVAHLCTLIPIVVVGVFCLLWEDLGLVELTRAMGKSDGQETTGC
ncbi:MAG TPA: hypothetical protein PLO37_01715 [Candidatus Hydrogenedentes bacterium]|nr:hypothetical protein [Candidatus Hydrogenedentota bacterium]